MATEAQRRYWQSEKGRATRQRFNSSEKGIALKRRRGNREAEGMIEVEGRRRYKDDWPIQVLQHSRVVVDRVGMRYCRNCGRTLDWPKEG